MNINNMNLIKIPVGYSQDDKKNYVAEFMRVFPMNEKKFVVDSWTRHYNNGVLLLILDVESGHTIAALRLTANGSTVWELHANFIKTIPSINSFRLENDDHHTNINKKDKSKNVIQYNIDEILDLISVKGYDKLTADQKEFLNNQSKK